MTSHPSREELAAFVSGRVNEPAAVILEAHVAGCERCRLILEGLSADSLAKALQNPADSLPTAPPMSPGGEPRPLPEDASAGSLPAALVNHPRYRVLDVLGRGGMGVVYKAEHRIMGRPVALKVIRPGLLQDPDAVARFRREIEAAARLSHPNIVTALDADQAGDMHFLVMEYVAGMSLADLLAREGPFSARDACAAARQVVLGLQHACALDMVHRDIKPHNLLRTEAGQVKILDFGLAHFATENLPPSLPLLPGSLLGTPHYVAPEQIRDPEAADFRADFYSLGCTLFHLLAGSIPFPAPALADQVRAHLERPPPLLTALRRDVPPELARLVFRLMAKHPDERIQTHAELLEALAPFLPEETRVLVGHTDQVLCVAFSPFGFLLASGSSDQTVKLWAVGGDKELDTLSGHMGPVRAVAFSPDGRTLATGSESRSVRLWDVARRKKRLSLKGHGGAVRTLAFHPDGHTLASAGDDGQIKLWDVSGGSETGPLAGHADRVQALAFSPDGRRLVSGGRDRRVIFWDFTQHTQERVLADHAAPVSALTFHPDGTTVAVASEAVHLYTMPEGKRSRTIAIGSAKIKIRALAFSPNGGLLSLGAGNHVLMSSLDVGSKVSFEGHSGPVLSLAFHPDGRLLASGSADGTIRIWQVP